MRKQKLSQAQLAAVLGVSRATIGRLVRDGVVVAAPGGGYDLAESVQRYVAHVKRHVAPSELQRERTVLVKTQSEAAELELRERRGELVLAADVRRCWEETMQFVRDRLLILPPAAAPLLAVNGRVQEVQGVLQELINEALAELARGGDAAAGRK